jgi:thymidylate synthase (FAD)
MLSMTRRTTTESLDTRSPSADSLDQAFVDRPSVLLMSRPQLTADVHRINTAFGSQLYPDHDGYSAERIVEVAGRVCYMSFSNPSGRSTEAYIANLIKQGHESVLEHASWTMILSGVSRAFTHQLVRHRVGFAFSQLSQQYVDQGTLRFVVPAEISGNKDLLEQWKTSMLELRRNYAALIETLTKEVTAFGSKENTRSSRSAARSILPNCIETIIAVTGNARAFRHFLSVRGSIEGDIEMRRVSAELLSVLKEEAPSIFHDFKQKTHVDGWPIVHHVEDDS